MGKSDTSTAKPAAPPASRARLKLGLSSCLRHRCGCAPATCVWLQVADAAAFELCNPSYGAGLSVRRVRVSLNVRELYSVRARQRATAGCGLVSVYASSEGG